MRISTLCRKKIVQVFTFLAFLTVFTSSFAQCPTITNTLQTFCDTQTPTPTVASLQANNTGGGIRWYDTATSSTTLSSITLLVNGEDYFADSNAGGCVRPRVVVTVNSTPRPIGNSFQGPCVEDLNNATLQDFDVTGTNIKWFANPFGGSPLPITTIIVNGSTYYATQTDPNTGCESLRKAVQAKIGLVPTPTGDPTQEFCNDPNNIPTVASLVASGSNNWYSSAGSSTPLDVTTPLVNGRSYFATTVDPPCESLTRFEVAVTLVKQNDAGINGIKRICEASLPTLTPFNLFDSLTGTPDATGVWTGNIATSNGNLGTINPALLSQSGSPYVFTYTVSSPLCVTSTSTVTVIIIRTPNVTVNSSVICSGNFATITATPAPAGNYDYVWIVPSGAFAPGNVSSFSTNVAGIYSVVATNKASGCSSLSKSGTVTVNPTPIISVATLPVCNGTPASVTVTPAPAGTYNYVWTVPSGASNPGNVATFTTSTAGVYSVIATNTITSCPSQASQATVVINPKPTVTVSSPPVCVGTSAVVTATPSPAGTYSYVWTVPSGVTNPGNVATFTTTTEGVYSVIVTNTLTTCVSIPNQATVLFNPIPTVSVSSPTVCSGTPATVTATPSPAGTYNYVWIVPSGVTNPGNVATFTTSVAGIYSVIATNSTTSCPSQVGQATVVINPKPTVSVSSSAVCVGSPATVTATPNPVGTYSYVWTVPSGVTNPGNVATFTSVTAGIYSVIVTNTVTTCVSLSGQSTVVINPIATVSVSSPPVCNGTSATVTATPSIIGVYNYVWTVPSGATNPGNVASFTTLTIGVYSVIITNSTTTCTSQPGQTTVVINPIPTVSVISSSACIGTPAVITATPSPSGTYNYIWTVPSGATNPGNVNSFSASTAGVYSVIINNTSTSCPSQPSQTTVAFNSKPTVTVSSPSVCFGSPATVTATANPVGSYSYVWTVPSGVTNPGNVATFTSGTAGLYSVIITNTATTCVSLSGQSSVVINPIPTVSVSSPPVCNGALATVTATPSIIGVYNYVWTVPSGVINPGNVASFTTSTVGVYSVIITNSTTTCTSQPGQTTVIINPIPTVSVSSSSACIGTPAVITATPSPAGTYNYVWTVPSGASNPGNVNSFSTLISGVYTVIVNNTTTSCPSQPSQTTVVFNSKPTVTVSSPPVCFGSTATVTATPSPVGAYSYVWTVPSGVINPGNVDTFTTTTVGVYSVIATNTTSTCVSLSGQTTLINNPTPTISVTSPQVCLGTQASVTAAPSPAGTYDYLWTVPSGATNPGNVATFTTATAGIYSVVTTNTTTNCPSQPGQTEVIFNIVIPPTGDAIQKFCSSSFPTVANLIANGTSVRWYLTKDSGIILDPSTPLSDGQYYYGESFVSPCSSATRLEVLVTINELNNAGGNGSKRICETSLSTLPLFNLFDSLTGTPDATGVWTGTVATSNGHLGTINPTLLSQSGSPYIFTYTVSSSSSCLPSTSTVTLIIVRTPVVTVKSDSVCDGTPASVTAIPSPAGIYNYVWTIPSGATNPGNSSTFTTSVAGVYSVIATNVASTCTSQPNQTTVVINPKPTVSVISSPACVGTPATITATPSPAGTYTYDWTVPLGATNPGNVSNFQTTIEGVYSVVITDATTTCSSVSKDINLSFIIRPIVTVSIPPVCSGSNASVTAIPTITGAYNYTWTVPTGAADPGNVSNFTSSVEGVYSVVLSDATTSCPSLSSDGVLRVFTPPTVTISSNATVCSGTNTTVTFTGTPNSIVTYTVNGGSNQSINIGPSGVAILDTTLSVTSTFSLVNITLSNPPSCSQALTDSIKIDVTQPPLAGSNANLTICSNSSPQDLFLLLGPLAQTGGTWSPVLSSGTGLFNPLVDSAGSYVYTVAGTPPCVNDTALVVVSIIPSANAGTDGVASLCSNADKVDLITFLGSSAQVGGTWSPALKSGSGIFDPAADAAGIYKYTVNGTSVCLNDSAIVNVTVTPGPDAGISGSTTLCLNSPSQDLFLSLGGTPQLGGTWTPALASGTGIFNPAIDKAGVYAYTFAVNPPCGDDSAIVTVTVNPLPDAGDSATAAICSNSDSKDLFTFLGGTPQAGGTWSPVLASGTGIFNPKIDLAGNYTYTVGDPFCTPDSAVLKVNIIPGPDAGLPGNVTFCVNNAPQDLFLSLGGTPQVGGTWSPALASGSGIFSPAVDKAGVYTYTFAGNQPCDDDTATVTVKVDPIPNAGTFVGKKTICNTVAKFDLFTLLTGSQTGGVWTNNTNQTVNNPIDVTAFTPNTYSYTYTVTTTCGVDFEIVQFEILPNPVLTSTNIVISSPNCKGDNVIVKFSNMVDGTYTINYNLSLGNVLNNQNATVTIINGLGSFLINAADIPNVGTTRVTFLNITNITSTCTTAINPNVSGDFILRPSSNLDNKNLVVDDVCIGSDVKVDISGAAIGLVDGNYQFNFNIPQATPASGTSGVVAIKSGAGQFTIPVSYFVNSGNYTLIITSITNLSAGCNNLNEDATTSFQVFPLPNVSGAILSAATTCLNFSNEVFLASADNLSDGIYTIEYQLSGASTLTSSASGTFTNGKGSFIIPASELNTSGNVTVKINQIISNVSQCGSSGSAINPITFEVNQLDTPILDDNGNEFCKTDNPTLANLSSNITNSSGTIKVIWYESATDTGPFADTDLLEDGNTYYGALRSASGCESGTRLAVTVDLNQCGDILIPDGFSPNNDGINDEFVILNILSKYPNFKLEIYNRYGNILYRGNRNTPDWNGTTTEGGIQLGNSTVPVGVYFYILDFNDGITKPKQGRLYLSR